MTPITTRSQRQLERTEAIRNSSIMANKNSTPSRAPTAAIEAGGEPQSNPRDDEPREAGQQKQPPGAGQPPQRCEGSSGGRCQARGSSSPGGLAIFPSASSHYT